ncbi:hypothetical protein C8F04DRAFT_1133594 [Mycena alexandri]|uniref:Uncharacterized protein n=1 Tax=Mycena alexandri TaxID=1745969 RepID=A0AAD6WUD6_9AGAR|nr:hypothetical protein C8F04DRAFT_1133594 [Mycena alexandri]
MGRRLWWMRRPQGVAKAAQCARVLGTSCAPSYIWADVHDNDDFLLLIYYFPSFDFHWRTYMSFELASLASLDGLMPSPSRRHLFRLGLCDLQRLPLFSQLPQKIVTAGRLRTGYRPLFESVETSASAGNYSYSASHYAGPNYRIARDAGREWYPVSSVIL